MKAYPHFSHLVLTDFERGQVHRLWLDLIEDAFGTPMSIPVFIVRGVEAGPVLGLTAAVHGDELNGIPVIQRFVNELNPKKLKGTVIGIPVMNLPSFFRHQRRFIDGVDLNHIMPGVADGSASQVYANRFVQRVLSQFDYLIDLHTASHGRINSYYVRADLSNPISAELARLQNPQIIVNNPPSDGTLRGEASERNIPAITVEVGNPRTFQRGLIRTGITGLHNASIMLGMVDDEIEINDDGLTMCPSSFWIYTDVGGLLRVIPEINQRVSKGELIATVTNIFGDKIAEYHAPEDGVVIGKSVNPVNHTGGRVLHLGRLE